jgi:DNA uptake protein ComE-like DNA-binding protein
MLELKAFGEKFPLEFDLNAAGDADWLAAGADRAASEKIQRERDKAPFASVSDFEKRTGLSLATLGLEEIMV